MNNQQKLSYATTPIAFFFLLKTESTDIRKDLWRVAQTETYLEAPFLFAQLNTSLCFILNEGVHR